MYSTFSMRRHTETRWRGTEAETERRGKGKVLPRTGHEGQEGQ